MSDRIVFSTDALPERDRFAFWREEYVRRHARVDVTTQDQSRFRAKIEFQRVGGIDISYIFRTPSSIVRTTDLLRDGDDTLFISLLKRGDGYHTQQEHNQK